MKRTALTISALMIAFIPLHGFSLSLSDAAPPFSVRTFESGDEISLEQFAGKVVYLDFWASWCGPCLKSFPFMNSLQEDYGEQGLVVIAVNLDQRHEDAANFLGDHSASFVVAENPDGDVAEQYGVIAMPSTYIIGRDGLVKEVHNGFRTKDEADLREQIVSLL